MAHTNTHTGNHTHTQVLEIDPMARTMTTFGFVGEKERTEGECAGAIHCGEEKWIGGVLAANGKIIGIPYAAESVLEIDPVMQTATTFGIVCAHAPVLLAFVLQLTATLSSAAIACAAPEGCTRVLCRRSSTVKRKWVEGVLGTNKRVYGIPYDADVVLEIDPENHALFIFGSLGRFGDSCKWYGGVLGVYERASYTRVEGPRTEATDARATPRTSAPHGGAAGWTPQPMPGPRSECARPGSQRGGVHAAPNGKIYGIPYSAPYVLEIDTDKRTAEPFAMTQSGWGKWSGGVLAGNGKIYGVPALAKGVLEIGASIRPQPRRTKLHVPLSPSDYRRGAQWCAGCSPSDPVCVTPCCPDVEQRQTNLYGMLPAGKEQDDKWNGAVLAPKCASDGWMR